VIVRLSRVLRKPWCQLKMLNAKRALSNSRCSGARAAVFKSIVLERAPADRIVRWLMVKGGSMASSYSRRWFVSRLGLLGCTLPLRASAQRPRPHRVGRIGFLGGGATLVEAF